MDTWCYQGNFMKQFSCSNCKNTFVSDADLQKIANKFDVNSSQTDSGSD